MNTTDTPNNSTITTMAGLLAETNERRAEHAAAIATLTKDFPTLTTAEAVKAEMLAAGAAIPKADPAAVDKIKQEHEAQAEQRRKTLEDQLASELQTKLAAATPGGQAVASPEAVKRVDKLTSLFANMKMLDATDDAIRSLKELAN